MQMRAAVDLRLIAEIPLASSPLIRRDRAQHQLRYCLAMADPNSVSNTANLPLGCKTTHT